VLCAPGVPYCSSPWMEMAHGANASELFAFVGGGHYGPPATAAPKALHRTLCSLCKPRPSRSYDPCVQATRVAADMHAPLAARTASAAWRRRNATAWPWAWERAQVARHYANATAPKPPLRWFGRRPAVAMHVRRGDVTWGGRLRARYVTNGRLAACAMAVLRTLPRTPPPDVHVFSEGAAVDFGPLQRVPRVQFHLNGPIAPTFHHLVRADVLVLAHSTLSSAAASLSAAPLFGVRGEPPQLRYSYEGRTIRDC